MASLEAQKIKLTQLEKDTRKKRNELRNNSKYLRKQCLATNAAETAIRAKRGKKDKSIANSIQSEVLDPKGCFVSSYHGASCTSNHDGAGQEHICGDRSTHQSKN